MTTDPKVIRSLARELLSRDTRNRIEMHLTTGATDLAVWRIIGNVDALFYMGRIGTSEIERAYKRLGVESKRFNTDQL